MANLISFMHISLDGFVCGPNGEMDWIKVNQEMFDHVEKRIKQTDTALYGRVTYQMMESYWPEAGKKADASKHDIEHSKWYSNAGKIVLSNSLADSADGKTKIVRGNFTDEIKSIKESAAREILVFGSPRATHSLISQNLIDGYWLFLNPIVLGKGIRLFTENQMKTKLSLTSTHRFNCGVTELCYTTDQKSN